MLLILYCLIRKNRETNYKNKTKQIMVTKRKNKKIKIIELLVKSEILINIPERKFNEFII